MMICQLQTLFSTEWGAGMIIYKELEKKKLYTDIFT
jgi:hypothetical protein